MNLRIFIVVLSLFVGFCGGIFWSALRENPQHWAAVEKFHEFEANPSLYITSSETVPDIIPTLWALVSHGDLQYYNFVFPTVCKLREAAWKNFSEKFKVGLSEKIVWAQGSSEYFGLPIKGEQPLQIHLYCRENSESLVAQIIKEAERFADAPEKSDKAN